MVIVQFTGFSAQCVLCGFTLNVQMEKYHHYKLVNRMIMSVNFVQQYRCLFGVFSDQSLIIIIHMYIHIL